MDTDRDNKNTPWQEYQADKEFAKTEKNEGLINEIKRENTQLHEEIKRLEAELLADTRDLQIKEDIPETKVKFLSVEKPKDDRQLLGISCSFGVSSVVSYELQKGQALITFEEEEVAGNVVSMGKHRVLIEDANVELTAQWVPLTSAVKFQVHIEVSKMKINVEGIPVELPEEQMRDKLELSFCRSRNGGGEVESVDYDRQSGRAVITFVEAGVADNILRKKEHPLYLSQKCHWVKVSPYMERRIEKYQVFSAVSKRTVLLTGMEEVQMDEETVEDSVSIHFQREKNGGGEVDVVKCSLGQPYTAYFEE